MEKYNPEDYWTDVAKRTSRHDYGVVAGDFEPYYTYKRNKFLELFRRINFKEKFVLEVGCGPGENLIEAMSMAPTSLKAVDISSEMVKVAKEKTIHIDIIKTNGVDLPFPEDSFDIVFTVTVLQHNTDMKMLEELIYSISRVSKSEVYFFERIERKSKGTELNMGHPVEYYAKQMSRYGFSLQDVQFLNIEVSYLIAGITRKLLNFKNRKEGDPSSKLSILCQKLLLPIAKQIDPFIKSNRGLAMLKFTKK